MKDGRQGQLVERCRQGNAAELTEKLFEHPNLSWVQAGLMDEFRVSSCILFDLAQTEVDLVARKKVGFG